MTGGLLAACSSGKPGANGTTSAPSSSSTSSPTSSTSSSTTGAAPTHCPASALAITVVGTQGAAGTFELTFRLHNTTAAPCTLQGYPGAQLYDAGGTALPTTVVRGGSYSFTDFAPGPVTLAPAGDAWFNMGYNDVSSGSGGCPTAASLWVTPPDAVDHAVVSHQIVACGGRLTVSPVFGPGSPGSQTTAPAPS